VALMWRPSEVRRQREQVRDVLQPALRFDCGS
jgi:hypothetical protein